MRYYLGLNSEENFDFDLFKSFSGVGMIRGENLCINKMQYFPIDSFCQYVTDYLNYVATNFPNNPVWYRTADLVPHQVNLLAGCDANFEEQQYLIGTRGIRRNLKFIDTYILELQAFLNAYHKNSNLGILLPFVSSVNEVEKTMQILKDLNYTGKIGVMIEIPSIMFMLDELNAMGVDNFTIGVNDLTTNLLGANRDNSNYSSNNIAVHKAISYITKKVHSFGKEITLAGYLNPELFEFAKSIGVDNINIHYNEIPLFFPNQDSLFFTEPYNNMKAKYKEIKRERKKYE